MTFVTSSKANEKANKMLMQEIDKPLFLGYFDDRTTVYKICKGIENYSNVLVLHCIGYLC